MAKRYTRVNFQNRPSVATPVNNVNLNTMDKGIDDLDNAIEDLYNNSSLNNIYGPADANLLLIGGDNNKRSVLDNSVTYTNSPVLGEFIGVRDVFIISSQHFMVVIRETYPVNGRVWQNFYNIDSWTGWTNVSPNPETYIFNHPLLNKTGVAYGDSITWGQNGASSRTDNPWTSVFSNITGCALDNRGIGGTCMAVGSGYGITTEVNNNAFCNRIDSETITGDIIFIMYGTNDYGYNIALGGIDDTVKTTFYGALNYSINKLITDLPSIKIVLCTPIYANTNDTPNVRGLTIYDYVNAVKNIAKKYNIALCNPNDNLGVNATNIASKYWDSALHPNDTTYIELGNFVAMSYPYNFNNKSKPVMYAAALTNSASGTGVGYWKDDEGYVHFIGKVTAPGNIFMTLPIGFRPSYAATRNVVKTADGTTTFCVINTSGEVSVGDTTHELDLGSIPPFFSGTINLIS